MAVLIAAIRIYVGGPDGLEVVWKGGLNFEDTVVNVNDYANQPRKEMLATKPALLSQMEEMGLYDSSDTPAEMFRKRRAKKLHQKKNEELKGNATSSENGTNATDTDAKATNTDAKATNTDAKATNTDAKATD
jgi:hypothetical protein